MVDTSGLSTEKTKYTLSEKAKTDLKELNKKKISDYESFFDEINFGIQNYSSEYEKRKTRSTTKNRNDIKKLEKLYKELSSTLKNLHYTAAELIMNESPKLESHWDIEKLEEDIADLSNTCSMIEIKTKRGQIELESDIAYYIYKALNKYRLDSPKISDSEGSVLVRNIDAVLVDISRSTYLGKKHHIAEQPYSKNSARSMARNLKCRLDKNK